MLVFLLVLVFAAAVTTTTAIVGVAVIVGTVLGRPCIGSFVAEPPKLFLQELMSLLTFLLEIKIEERT